MKPDGCERPQKFKGRRIPAEPRESRLRRKIARFGLSVIRYSLGSKRERERKEQRHVDRRKAVKKSRGKKGAEVDRRKME